MHLQCVSKHNTVVEQCTVSVVYFIIIIIIIIIIIMFLKG